MYFDFLPSIQYDLKPISYPFSESDYVVAKNFFRRYKISDTAFNYTVFYKKYALNDQVRLDQIAEAVYGNPFYDWVIALVNNMINPLYDLPMTEAELRKHIESSYSNPYYDIHHYEIIGEEEQTNKFGKVLMPGGTWVDESFYNDKKTLVADTFPDLSSRFQTLRYNNDYLFSSTGFDNGFVESTLNATFQVYGSGQGEDGGFVIYPPLKNNKRPDGYLRFRGDDLGERFAIFNSIDSTHLKTFKMYAKYGNDINGGEEPDELDELLYLEYRVSPSDPWVTIDPIIPVGVLQYFEWDGTQQISSGFGGTGRPQGFYENVPVYELVGVGLSPTPILVNVTVESDGYVSDIEFVDRGYDLGVSVGDLYILNEDIGNGYWFDSEGVEQYLPNLLLFNASTRQTPAGLQYSRFGVNPFEYVVDIPESAKTPTTQFRLYQSNLSGVIFDQYAIQSVEFLFEQTITIETSFDYTRLDDDNYVIDGVRWIRDNGTWYRVSQIGYRYYDNGLTKEISGSELSRPVTEFEYESNENEKKREIYILKPAYLDRLVDDFRKAALYKKSSDFVSNRLKKTGV